MGKFKEFLGNAEWHDFYHTEDENEMLNTFYKIYNNAFNKAFPLKQLVRGLKINYGSLIKCVHHMEKVFQNYVKP